MTQPPGSGYDAVVHQEPLKTCCKHLRTRYTTLALKHAVDPRHHPLFEHAVQYTKGKVWWAEAVPHH